MTLPALHVLIFSVLALILQASAWYDCFEQTMCDNLQNTELTVEADDSNVHVRWNHSQTDKLFGFQVDILDADKSIVYESPILHAQTKSMDFKTDLPSGKSYICLHLLFNLTSSAGQVCDDIKISDMKVVIGTLAGVVFLVPCLVILAVFIYKDKQIRKTDIEYQKLKGNGNDSFVNEEKATTKVKQQQDSVLPEPKNNKKKIKTRVIKELIVEEPKELSKTQTKSVNGVLPVSVQRDNDSTISENCQEKPVFVIHV